MIRLSPFINVPYDYFHNFCNLFNLFLIHRSTPVIQALARANMLSIITVHPTLHPTWRVTTPAPAHPPPPPLTPSRSHPLVSQVKPSQTTQQVSADDEQDMWLEYGHQKKRNCTNNISQFQCWYLWYSSLGKKKLSKLKTDVEFYIIPCGMNAIIWQLRLFFYKPLKLYHSVWNIKQH